MGREYCSCILAMITQNIPFGAIDSFNVLVEIPEGSKVKYEYSKEQDILVADFMLIGETVWPFNYGEIFGTLGGDGDRLDAIVISTHPLLPGSVVACRAIGRAEIVDRGQEDNKIICVPNIDRDKGNCTDLDSLSEEQIRNFNDFFIELAAQKNKIMEVKGWHTRERAEEELKKARV